MMEKEITDSIYCGGNGASIETPVVINATSTSQGIHAEYEFITNLYGQMNVDWFVVRQLLVRHEDKFYDILEFKLNSGEEKTMCFDISKFYGKF